MSCPDTLLYIHIDIYHSSSIFKVRESRSLNRRFVDALWQWRRVKTSTDSVGQSLQKEFLIDDTGEFYLLLFFQIVKSK